MRALSETIQDIETRTIMLRLADEYEKANRPREARALSRSASK
jgi:hypothetical protein